MQMSSLINLVDVHTQSKAYLPMDVVDNLHIYAWWKRWGSKIHSNSDKAMHDMVHTSLMQNSTIEIKKTNMIYKTVKMVRDKSAEEKEENNLMLDSI